MIDIDRMIDKESLAVWFQPIVSVRRQTTQILEALTRGIDPGSGEIIPPLELFAAAELAGRLGELELLCIRKALENFSRLMEQFPETLVSLNIGIRLLDQMRDFCWLTAQLQRLRIPANRIIIEVLETVLLRDNSYAGFLGFCRENGMLVALDDVGSEYSGLMRIVEVKPDMIKIDRSLIRALHEEKWQLEVVRALTGLAHHTGVLTVAEGVETEEEAMSCLELGIDLHQGFLFSRAQSCEHLRGENCCREPLRRMAELYRQQSHVVQSRRRDCIQGNLQEVNEIFDELVKVNFSQLEETLQRLAARFSRVQFLYILDEKGTTVTNTIGRIEELMDHRRYIFRPARKGEDLSLKDYFLWLQTGLTKYVSDPYISSATGRECVTYSVRFTTADLLPCVLCVDIRAAVRAAFPRSIPSTLS